MPKDELNAVVTQRLEVTPDLIILRVVPDGWELPAFEAGQFGVIGLPPEAPRTEYSDPVRRLREAAERLDPAGVFDCIFFGGNRVPRVLYYSGEVGGVDAQVIRARNWRPPLVGPQNYGYVYAARCSAK